MAETSPPLVPPPGAGPAGGTATVADRRAAPQGVIPRRAQTWLLAGLAAFMLLVMLVVGRPDAPARPGPTAAAAVAPIADRVRDYQDRLRALEHQTLAPAAAPPAMEADFYGEPPAPAPPDAIEADRKRREYESLFASNVVLSRRADGDRPDAGRPYALPARSAVAPTMDEIADAAVRATARAGAGGWADAPVSGMPVAIGAQAPGRVPASQSDVGRTPDRTEAISAAGPLHRVLEGTMIDAVLTNRLDGTSAAPVNCLVTNPLYSHSGRHVLIPAGARVLGETKPVQAFGETRLAVSFHRLLLPDGRTYRLDQFLGLNQIGDAGLRDRVNHHYLATFGAAAAVGLISGLSYYLGTAGLGQGDGDRTVVIAGGVGDATSQATLQVMSRFLNRLPTVTIREGHRVKVYLTSDLELPAYVAPALPGPF